MPYTNDILRDALLDKLIADCDVVHVLATDTNVYATVVADSFASFTPTITKGDYTGMGGGRAAFLTAIDAVPVSATGTVALNYFAFVDSVNSIVLSITDSNGKTFEDGDFINVPLFALDIVKDTVNVV